jgi:hypothetical protein
MGRIVNDDSSTRTPYLPILALPYWPIIGEFVEAAVHDCARVCERHERDLFAAATPMVLWCWRARGTPLERKRVFRHSMIEQFIHLGMPGTPPGSRATLRSSLWRMAEVLNPGDAHGAHRPIPRSAPTCPYSEADVAALYSWANTQGTPRRRFDALAMLALGLGAGLATRELLEVRTGDIGIEPSPVGQASASIVVWRDRSRVVPVQHDWVRSLQTVMATRDDDAFVFCPGRESATDGQVTNFLTRSRTNLDVRPVRMRATWLVRHLEAGMPAHELLRISGLQNYAALDKLVPFARKSPDSGDFSDSIR